MEEIFRFIAKSPPTRARSDNRSFYSGILKFNLFHIIPSIKVHIDLKNKIVQHLESCVQKYNNDEICVH